MKSITITAAMNRMVTCLSWGMTFEAKSNTLIAETLRDPTIIPYPPTDPNKGMYVQPGFDPLTETRDLKLGLLMIGRGGHGYQTDGNGEINPTTYPHKATHTGMFKPMPFLARTLTNDLTGVDKTMYRLRVTGEISGVVWVFYFGRIFDASQEEILEVLETVQNGVVTSTLNYLPSVNDLHPVHEDLSVDSEGIFMRTYASASIGFTEEQIAEIQYACTILYGDAEKAVISELAFCFGKDKPVTQMYSATASPTLSAAVPNTSEFVFCHMGIVESTFKPILYTGAVDDIKNIGISEPLYGGR